MASPGSASGNPNPQNPNNPNNGTVPQGKCSGSTQLTPATSPKGRYLSGDHILYDIDVRLPGEVPIKANRTGISNHSPFPGLVLGRRLAVAQTHICYPFGPAMSLIRVLNVKSFLTSTIQGLDERVTDLAFFAEDVHLLASASVNGRVYIWKITEDENDKHEPEITSQIVIAIQIVGEGESFHPRVCWHCEKQEILIVGIGKRVLKIDTTHIGKGEVFTAKRPLRCPVDCLVEGVQLVGTHDGEVTDLSMSQLKTTTLLVSASVDGMIKIWEDLKSTPIAVLRPHDGQPVNSVTFFRPPDSPKHIVLITGGPLNREVKIWSSASEEGWLVPSDAEPWHCTQTLELKSSAETQVEDAFFNQVVAFPRAGLLLLSNAKKNSIYVVHLEYGPNPAATRMNYIAEFTVTMPILSFTGTRDLLPCEHVVQVYCVETQAIHKYALDLSQCLPPPLDNVVLQRSESSTEQELNTYVDALWVRALQDETAKQEKLLREDLPERVKDLVKKELSAFVEVITPVIEKTVSKAISEAFQKQKGVGENNQV
ncbi:enhancer of mRNA-decapping protein 4-like isoform X4 [Ipomoea triloba]|uniref:enhancer of mRNA-decapping protein 4-like isoform X1 n=1 Tax=Ipomoea triloba TaxID=35885 RepID=UPI00125D3B45|nr:enhancer of mRNA-decapping protein 4-like isoform X1 [Ipomoea triloba]XP_031098961.1 enhancer of mRNA-decapping protein 4-like isoform X2 [Ipomoea triloba]XP_031098962.1 enhancer of mRNA-decapping protein 4-like isoform X3 [Ipomoea triloba]XP_031098963.1 enhancer of mRNA-decapping protein 4-like isoform X4 [Ipomoea triloba]